MKAILLCVLLSVALVSASASSATFERVLEKRRVRQQQSRDVVTDAGQRIECDRIVNCDACAKKQEIGGRLANPCYWDWLSRTCNFDFRQPHFCKGNQGFATAECNRCQREADKVKAAQAQAATAAAAQTTAQANAAKAAGKAGKRCSFNGGPGICVFSTGECKGRPFARSGCMNPNTPVCCGLAVKNHKNFKNDSCNKHNGAKNCWACLRAGCEMHVSTQLCTNRRSGFGRAGDANVVGSEAMCYTVAQKRDASRAAVRAKAKAKRARKF